MRKNNDFGNLKGGRRNKGAPSKPYKDQLMRYVALSGIEKSSWQQMTSETFGELLHISDAKKKKTLVQYSRKRRKLNLPPGKKALSASGKEKNIQMGCIFM